MKLIYRTADRLIVGSVTPPQSEVLELRNILQSELGGIVADYAITAEVPPKSPFELYAINPNGDVVVTPDPVRTARLALRVAAANKLRGLGLTTPELIALGLV